MVKCLGPRRSHSPEPPESILPKPEANTELRRIIVRRLKAPSPEYDPENNSVLLILAPEIIAFVTDFFTLVNLSRTCRALYETIRRRPAIRHALFDVIEIPDTLPPDLEIHRHHDTTYVCRFILREKIDPRYWSPRRYDEPNRREMDVRLNHISLFNAAGFNFQDIQDAPILPCYGCKRIKSHSQFFEHYKIDHLTLLGCLAKRRRCIDCVFANPVPESEATPAEETDHWPWATWSPIEDDKRILGDPKFYLVDMPKGIPGYRQRCQVCAATSWVRKRPRKALEADKVCEDCWSRGLRGTSPNPRTRKVVTPVKDETEIKDTEDVHESSYLGYGLVDQFPRYENRRLSGSRFDLLPEE